VARAVARLDRRRELAILPIDDAEAEPLLRALPEEERDETWHIVAPDGAIAGHGAGVVDLLLAMRLTRPTGRALAHVPPGLLDRVYGAVARNRGRLGRLVPDGRAPRRL
jgi:predicted DCC family thiol-disulfide oxidoreductase YuxK